MYWLLIGSLYAQEPVLVDNNHKEIYVSPPTINDPTLNDIQDNFAMVIMKLYDEDAQLIASTSKSSYSVEQCKTPVKTTTIKQGPQPATEIVEVFPEKCKIIRPSILDKDIKQAVTILFASVHPKR